MGDPLKHVQPGSSLVIEAATWNRLVDAAGVVEGLQRFDGGSGAPRRGAARAAVYVSVKNTTGATIPSRGIVTPSGTALNPDTSPVEASEGPFVIVSAPTATTDPVLVSVHPIEDGASGTAVSAGVTVAQVSVTSTAHRFAKPIAGTSTHLASAATGPVRLLVAPATTGTQMAYVLLGGAGATTDDPDGGLTDGKCKGGAWTIALRDTDRWTLQMLGGPGPIVIEPPDSDDDTEITINGVVYIVDWVYGAPSLTFTPKLGSGVPITATLDCLACPCFRFGVERIKFYPDEDIAAGVCERLVYFTVCQYCPAGWYCARPAGTDEAFIPRELLEGEACSGDWEIKSGPYATEDDAPCGTVTVPCSTFGIPKTLVMRLHSTAGYTGLDGKVVDLVYGAGIGPDAGGLIPQMDGWWGCVDYFLSGGTTPATMMFFLGCGNSVGRMFLSFTCQWGCDKSSLQFFPISGDNPLTGPPYEWHQSYSGTSLFSYCIGPPGTIFDLTIDITES